MANALVSWVQLPCCPKFLRSNKLVEKRQADLYGPIAPRGSRSSFRRLGPHKVSAYLADSVTESVSEVLRRVGVNPEERRLALVLALGTQAGRRTEKGAQSVNLQARGPCFSTCMQVVSTLDSQLCPLLQPRASINLAISYPAGKMKCMVPS